MEQVERTVSGGRLRRLDLPRAFSAGLHLSAVGSAARRVHFDYGDLHDTGRVRLRAHTQQSEYEVPHAARSRARVREVAVLHGETGRFVELVQEDMEVREVALGQIQSAAVSAFDRGGSVYIEELGVVERFQLPHLEESGFS